MKSIVFNVNGQSVTVEAEPEKPLLWVLREDLGLTGAKYGCGMALCGCCTVHLNGKALKSCTMLAVQADGAEITSRRQFAIDDDDDVLGKPLDLKEFLATVKRILERSGR